MAGGSVPHIFVLSGVQWRQGTEDQLDCLSLSDSGESGKFSTKRGDLVLDGC